MKVKRLCSMKNKKVITRIMVAVALLIPAKVIASNDLQIEANEPTSKEIEYTLDYYLSEDKTKATISLQVVNDGINTFTGFETPLGDVITPDQILEKDKYVVECEVQENKEYAFIIYFKAKDTTSKIEDVTVNTPATETIKEDSYIDKEKKVSISIADINKMEVAKESTSSTAVDNSSQQQLAEPIETNNTNLRSTIEENELRFTRIGDTNTASVNGNPLHHADVTIPKTVTIDGVVCTVTTIESYSFRGTSVQTVVLPDSITTLQDYAFSQAKDLTSVTLPNSITTMGEEAFSNTPLLTTLTIPGSVTTMGISLCMRSGLKSVIIDEGITSIPGQMFWGCTSLTSVQLPSTIKQINTQAFYQTAITSINLNEGLTDLIGACFQEAKNLVGVTFPDSLKTIGMGTFSGCTSLQRLAFREGLESIGSSAFRNCTSLTTMKLPDSLTTIGLNAFTNTALPSVTIPKNMSTIWDGAFSDCANLTAVTFSSSTVPLTIKKMAFSSSGIKNITIPKNVTDLGAAAFMTCPQLETVVFEGDTIVFSPDSQGYGYQFRECPALQSIVLPKNLTTLQGYTFYGCTSLENIDLPEALTKTGVGEFFNCTAMQEIYIPNSLTNIGEATFRALNKNTKIFIKAPTLINKNDRPNNAIKVALENEYCKDTDGVSKVYYSYDPTGASGNIFFGDVTKLTAVGDTSITGTKGATVPLKVALTTNVGFVNDELTWTMSGNSDATTSITGNNEEASLVIGTNETGPIVIVATSTFDSSKTVTYNVSFATRVTVTFDTNGGNSIAPVTIDSGNTIHDPGTPTKAGYTFEGWYTEAAFTNEFDFTTPITADVTLYAKWKVKEFTVAFDTNGGTPASITSQTIKIGEKVVAPTEPTKTGYTFEGWYAKSDFSGTAWNFTNDIVITDITLYAKWKAEEFTIGFNTNGGTPTTIANQTIKKGEKVTEPTEPTKTGYVFDGWYAKSDLTGTAWNFTNDTVTTNVTLYAKWNANNNTISFDTNGGTPAITSQTVKTGEKVTKPNDPTKTGYVFDGWYTKSDLSGTAWNFTSDTVNSNLTLYAKWKEGDFTVGFNTNGGTPTTINSQTVKTGEKVTKPNDPTKTGYTFEGWYAKSDLSGIAWNFTSDTVNSNLTLYAKWNANNNTISFDTNDGTPTITNQTVKTGEKVTKPNDPTKTGYTFEGWYAKSDLSGTAWNFTSDTVNSNLTLYAKWNANNNTISFDTNGGTPAIASQTVKSGEKVIKPNDPTKTGYVFDGWYAKGDLSGTAWNFASDTVNSNLTLYAKWKKGDFTVSFNTNGGTPTTITSQIVKTGEKVIAPIEPTKAGYTFEGWYTEAAFTNEFDFTTPITADVTLYAKWKVKEFMVAFDTNGGTPASITSQTIKIGEKVVAPTEPTKTGYTFEGWYAKSDFSGTAWNFTNDIVITDITLYAKWKAEEFTIGFNTNGGTPAITNQTVKSGEKVTKPNDPTKTGYTFEGWYTKSDLSGTAWNFTNDTVNSNLTLYAKWKIEEFTVSFNTNGGTPTIINQIVKMGEKITEPTEPIRAGYTFEGWYAMSDFTGTAWNFTNDTVTANLTLYAKWKAKEWKITYNSNGGSSIVPQMVMTNNKIIKPTAPNKENYIFSGWYKDVELTIPWQFDYDTVNGNLTLYAKWVTSNSYTVIFDSNGGNYTPENQLMESGTNAIEPTTPSKDGYDFIGWYVQGSNTKWNFKTDKLVNNIILEARWQNHEAENPGDNNNSGDNSNSGNNGSSGNNTGNNSNTSIDTSDVSGISNYLLAMIGSLAMIPFLKKHRLSQR